MTTEAQSQSKSGSKKGTSKTNLILALLLITVSTFAYWYEFKKKKQLDKVADEKTKLIALDSSREIESVQIVEKEKNVDINIVCKTNCKLNDPNASWEIESPIRFKADEGNIATFVTTISNANIVETIHLDGNIEGALESYGLGKAKRQDRVVKLKIKGADQPYFVYFGENSAVGDNLYVKVEGPNVQSANDVFLIPGYTKNSIQKNLSYWRAKKLFDFATSEIESFSLKNATGTIDLKKEGANWLLSSASNAVVKADNEAVDTFLTGLVFTNAQEFVSDDKQKDRAKLAIPAKPHYSVTVRVAKRAAPVVLEVFDYLTKDKTPKIYATLSDKNFIVELDRQIAEKMSRKLESFRIKNLLLAADRDATRNISVTFNGRDQIELEQTAASQWKLTSGKIDNFDSNAVVSFLSRVTVTKVSEFLGKKPLPTGAVEVSAWKFFDKTAKEPRALRSFAVYKVPDAAASSIKDKSEYYVKFSDGEIAKIDSGAVAAVPTTAAGFQSSGQPKPPAAL